MGHGDEIVFADAHFPGDNFNDCVVRADGHKVADLLDAVLSLMCLDTYMDDLVVMMQPVPGDELVPAVETAYREASDRHWSETPQIARMERFAFYERAEKAFCVVMTGEIARYGNIILKKGVTPIK
jgi:L-fucose mutarotase